MLRVRGRAPVSARENLAVGEQRFHHDLDRLGDGLGENLVRLELELGAVVEVAAAAIEQDDVEPAGRVTRPRKVVPRGGDEPGLLVPVHAVRRTAEVLRAAQPDFGEHQRVPVPENEIDFSPAAPVAALDESQALTLEVRCGDLLGAIAGVHRELSSDTPTPSRNTAWIGSRCSELPPRYEILPVTPSRLIVCWPASSWLAMRQESMPSA